MFFFVYFANIVLLLLVKNKHGTIPFLQRRACATEILEPWTSISNSAF